MIAPGQVWRKVMRTVDPPTRYLRGVTGIIHIGANRGQERHLYAAHDLDVLWAEPAPDVFAELVHNIASHPKQRAVQALVTDRVGERHRFGVASNGGVSSSMLDLHRHREIWPEIAYTGHLDLVSTTVDALVAQDGRRFDALAVDAQGAELLVLQGARDTLPGLEAISAEAADFEAYKGGTTVDELVDYLRPQGFRLARRDLMTRRAGVGGYYDLLFLR